MSEAKFHVDGYVVEVDGKPGAIGVVFPDCPGCCAMGDTVEEAIENAALALEDWLAAIKQQAAG